MSSSSSTSCGAKKSGVPPITALHSRPRRRAALRAGQRLYTLTETPDMLQSVDHLNMLHLSLCLGHDCCWCCAKKKLRRKQAGSAFDTWMRLIPAAWYPCSNASGKHARFKAVVFDRGEPPRAMLSVSVSNGLARVIRWCLRRSRLAQFQQHSSPTANDRAGVVAGKPRHIIAKTSLVSCVAKGHQHLGLVESFAKGTTGVAWLGLH